MNTTTMINSNEKLLPGNVVMCNKSNTPVVLYAIGIYRIAEEDLNEDYSPIPLTPEVLVGWCGLKEGSLPEDKIRDWIIDDELKIRLFDGKWYLVYWGCHVTLKTTNPPLHLIQNTTYFLTGKEIQINIPKDA